MEQEKIESASKAEERFRWIVTYSVSGDLRFISHHDTLRLFQRALARAAVLVRYSAGFNPRPRITIPLPRPVGIASDDEALTFETTGPADAEAMLTALSRQMPEGLRLLKLARLDRSSPMQPTVVRYRVEPASPPIADLPARVEGILQSDVVRVERESPKKATRQSVNIRPYIDDIVLDGGAVYMTLSVTQGGAAKPAEVAAILGYGARHVNHLIRRLEIQWK
jgi:radical SAM-linked protein